MEKRKRRGVNRKVSVSDQLQKSSQLDSLSEKKLCNEVESVSIQPIPSPSVKAPQCSQLTVKHNHFNRSTLVRKPRYCDWKYSLRNMSYSADASTSHGNRNARYVEKIISNDPRLQTGGQSSHTPEGNISNLLAANVIVSDDDSGKTLLCGICERGLSRNPINLGGNSIISGGELSVVAVLACGHLYHADCLEQRTCIEDRMDPSCPLCI